jgi:hypothetical protein
MVHGYWFGVCKSIKKGNYSDTNSNAQKNVSHHRFAAAFRGDVNFSLGLTALLTSKQTNQPFHQAYDGAGFPEGLICLFLV